MLFRSTNNIAFAIMLVLGAFPLWTIVAKYSNNLFFDAILYDSILIISYTIATAYFTQVELKPINLIGILMLFASIILVKI